jgi:8-amino-7-oxononanoate synthase
VKKLQKRELVRSLKLPAAGIDFTSNDYLGLARSQELHHQVQKAYSLLPVSRNGSTGSRLLSGNSELIVNTELTLSKLFNSESCLLFDSGYNANLAVLSTLPQKGDTIIMDELSHASLRDGARLSLATKWNFRHNDVNDLKRKLAVAKGNKWIVVESIYSMDGDVASLKEIAEIAHESGAQLIVDEAHSTGVHGAGGNGLANELSLADQVPIRIYTFGKAMGIHGACVACDNSTKDLLVNFSRPFIYTTAPSDHSIVSVNCAFGFLKANAGLQSELRNNIDLFRNNMTTVSNWNGSKSQIQIMLVAGHENVLGAAAQLQSAGYDVRPILAPTVKAGTERLRICLHTYNTNAEIIGLTTKLRSLNSLG